MKNTPLRLSGRITCVLACSLLLLSSRAAQAQENDSTYILAPDSTRMYQLGSITINDRRINKTQPLSQSVVSMAELNRSDAATVADLIYEVPAARVQTNSRGEAILYMRNAGERQVSIFMDGALINVPWDNRIDLSLVPLNAVGGLVAEKNTPSVLYGANVMGGAVNIATRELGHPGSLTEAKVGAGENGYLNTSLTHLGNYGSWNYIGSVSLSQRDGLSLSSNAELPFSQSDPDMRTNTDSKILSGYARGEYHLDDNDAIGLAVSLINGEKGVAPESHIDPEVDRVRFWRYPDWQNLNVTGTWDLKFGTYDDWNLRGALWTTMFSQRIEQFDSDTYQTVAEAQEDEDFTLGGRAILSRDYESGIVSLAVNQLYSSHDQVDSEYDDQGVETKGDLQQYAQNTFSVGAEYEGRLSRKVQAVVGASFDGMITLKSADKPEQDPFLAPGITTGATYSLDSINSVRAVFGRKTRFPSMRELYGEALRRFLVNTDLEPESSWNGELGYTGRFSGGYVEATGFMQLTSNTIDQRQLDTLGGTKRQRINLPGSRIFGIELNGSVSALKPFRVNGHLMWSYVRGIAHAADGSDSLTHLAEKPEAVGTLNLGYDLPFGLLLDAEAQYTGTAFSPGNDGLDELDPSLVFNGRVAYRWIQPFTGVQMLEVSARVDNITDELTLPQMGLPGPGREVRGALKLVL